MKTRSIHGWDKLKWNRIVALVSGKGKLICDDFHRPLAMRFDESLDEWYPTIAYFNSLADEMDFRQIKPEVVIVLCQVCRAMIDLHSVDGHDAYRARQIAVPALSWTCEPWVFRSGERAGELRLEKIIVCSGCARMATKVMHERLANKDIDEELLGEMLPRDVLPRFKRWLENEDRLEEDDEQMTNEVQRAFWSGK